MALDQVRGVRTRAVLETEEEAGGEGIRDDEEATASPADLRALYGWSLEHRRNVL